MAGSGEVGTPVRRAVFGYDRIAYIDVLGVIHSTRNPLTFL